MSKDRPNRSSFQRRITSNFRIDASCISRLNWPAGLSSTPANINVFTSRLPTPTRYILTHFRQLQLAILICSRNPRVDCCPHTTPLLCVARQKRMAGTVRLRNQAGHIERVVRSLTCSMRSVDGMLVHRNPSNRSVSSFLLPLTELKTR